MKDRQPVLSSDLSRTSIRQERKPMFNLKEILNEVKKENNGRVIRYGRLCREHNPNGQKRPLTIAEIDGMMGNKQMS